jgi:transcription initiation factor TFIIIB Brf1 subunit/transcription initiation factor TFIIB
MKKVIDKRIWASKELKQKRKDICTSCEHVSKKELVCMQCGCFIKAKISLELLTCPIGKW